MAYDFIKSSKKEGLHPLALSTDDIVFWKNHIGGVELANNLPQPPPPPLLPIFKFYVPRPKTFFQKFLKF